MKKALYALSLVILSASCSSNPETIQESERDAMIDSLVAVRVEEISRQAAEDLDRRRSIEVKAKADSIVAAMDSLQMSPADNTIPNNLPMP